MFRHLDQDAVFGPLVRRLLSRIVDLCGADMRSDVVCGRGTLLIASPHRVTAYHNIDSDVNFLLQLRGDKLFSVFDPHDRTLLSEMELEHYYAGDYNGRCLSPSDEIKRGFMHCGPVWALMCPVPRRIGLKTAVTFR